MGEVDQVVIYDNPKGLTELEVMYGGSLINIKANGEIKYASGAEVLSATGGVWFTDKETYLEGGWAWYDMAKGHAEFWGTPKIKQPVSENLWSFWEGETILLDMGDNGINNIKLINTKESRIYIREEDLEKSRLMSPGTGQKKKKLSKVKKELQKGEKGVERKISE